VSENVWDLLQGRQLPTQDVPIPRDPAAHAAAERAVEVATRALQLAHSRGVADLAPLAADVEAAQKVLDDQPAIVFTARCIPPGEWEELAAAHPPTAEQRKQGWQWNVTTFRAALLEAAVEPKMSEHQWHAVAETGRVGLGELDMLFATVVNLNTRQPQVNTGKG
jgi:hypothetical protein